MYEPYGHPPPAQSNAASIPVGHEWRAGYEQLRDLLLNSPDALCSVPTRHVGRRTGSADGVDGGVLFANAATVQFRIEGPLPWRVVYIHEKRAFLCVRDDVIDNQLEMWP